MSFFDRKDIVILALFVPLGDIGRITTANKVYKIVVLTGKGAEHTIVDIGTRHILFGIAKQGDSELYGTIFICSGERKIAILLQFVVESGIADCQFLRLSNRRHRIPQVDIIKHRIKA